MKTVLYGTYILLFSVILVSCNNLTGEATDEDVPEIGIPESFDYGKVENNVYRNKYFKCSMRVPANWNIVDKETMDELAGNASERVAGDDEELKQAIEVGQINSANLLSVSKFDLATATEPNPNVMILAENVSRNPQVTEGKDYLESVKELMRRSQMNYTYISDDLKKEVINGTTFYRMDATLTNNMMEIQQCYLVTITKKFAFAVIITYFTEEEKAFIDEYVRTLKFEKEDA